MSDRPEVLLSRKVLADLLCIEKFDATVWNTKTNLHCIFYVDDAVGNSCHFGCDQCSILRPLVTTIAIGGAKTS